MKKLSLLSIILALIISLPSTALPDDSEENAAIEKAITDFYIGGLKASDPNLLDQIFHQEWTLMMLRDGAFQKIDRETYLGYADPSRPSPFTNAVFKIAQIDVTGTAANAKIIYRERERHDYRLLQHAEDRRSLVDRQQDLRHGHQVAGSVNAIRNVTQQSSSAISLRDVS